MCSKLLITAGRKFELPFEPFLLGELSFSDLRTKQLANGLFKEEKGSSMSKRLNRFWISFTKKLFLSRIRINSQQWP